MQKIQLFLASSEELKADREQFEIFINRKNKFWAEKEVFLELIIWEDFLDAMSRTRLQDEYNKVIRECDIFVMLFATKVGKYTAEEFEVAYQQFKATGKPLIFTYFKDTKISTDKIKEDAYQSLKAFQVKLNKLGHFWTKYQNTEGLWLHFGNQLDKLVDQAILSLIPIVKTKNHIEDNLKISKNVTKERVFISYDRHDEVVVRQLYNSLVTLGFNPWMDIYDLLGGEDWDLAITNAIKSATIFLACLSKNSYNKRGYIQKEIKKALDIWKEKLLDDIYLIPVELSR